MSQENRPAATDWADLPLHPAGWDATTLPPNEVHLWRIELEVSPEVYSRCAAHLAPDETARTERFRLPHLRARYSIARGAVREIVAGYANRVPRELRFTYSPQGKPSLADDRSLMFNVSHSGGLALLAVCRDRRLGVDLESREKKRDLAQIAARTFSHAENAALLRLPEAERASGFYACWTLKEAYLKATGDGLSTPLDSFDVTFPPMAPASISIDGKNVDWQAHSFTLRDNAAALVIEGQHRCAILRAEWITQMEQPG